MSEAKKVITNGNDRRNIAKGKIFVEREHKLNIPQFFFIPKSIKSTFKILYACFHLIAATVSETLCTTYTRKKWTISTAQMRSTTKKIPLGLYKFNAKTHDQKLGLTTKTQAERYKQDSLGLY